MYSTLGFAWFQLLSSLQVAGLWDTCVYSSSGRLVQKESLCGCRAKHFRLHWFSGWWRHLRFDIEVDIYSIGRRVISFVPFLWRFSTLKTSITAILLSRYFKYFLTRSSFDRSTHPHRVVLCWRPVSSLSLYEHITFLKLVLHHLYVESAVIIFHS